MKPMVTQFAASMAKYVVVLACSTSSVVLGQDTRPAATQDASPERLPNIIIIVTDDQALGRTGFEGDPAARTPNLDRLAREGAYFTRAYTPCPLCSPSRASLLTGLYPHQHGVRHNLGAVLKSEAVTFPELLRQRGYACGLVGKWHLGNAHKPQAGLEDRWVSFELQGKYDDPELWIDGGKVPAQGYLTDVLTDYAIEFIEDHAREPFMLLLAYKAPHKPHKLHPNPEYRYKAEEMSLPKSRVDDLSAKPARQRIGRAHRTFERIAPDRLRERMSHYYAKISCIDHNVGRVIDCLGGLGVERNTLLFYTSDNGLLLGEHQMIGKGAALYEELVRVPLIMWWPGRIDRRGEIDALVSHLDIFPTVCGLVDLETPVGLPGRDLLPLLGGAASALRETLFFEYTYYVGKTAPGAPTKPLRGLATQHYKYTDYHNQGEELYDLRSDPHEMVNLIEDPAHKETAESLRQKLNAWRAQTGDVR